MKANDLVTEATVFPLLLNAQHVAADDELNEIRQPIAFAAECWRLIYAALPVMRHGVRPRRKALLSFLDSCRPGAQAAST